MRREPSAVLAPEDATHARWVGPTRVPLVLEANATERDLAALSAVFAFWGRPTVTSNSAPSTRKDEPLLAGDVQRFARAAGLDAVAFHGTLEDVVYELTHGRPVLVSVASATGAPHYEVVVGWDPAARRVRNLDPARGFIERPFSGFQSEWQLAKQLILVVFATEDPSSLDGSSKVADEAPSRSPTKS